MISEWCVECDCVCDVMHVLLECPLLESRRLQLYDSMAAVMGEDRVAVRRDGQWLLNFLCSILRLSPSSTASSSSSSPFDRDSLAFLYAYPVSDISDVISPVSVLGRWAFGAVSNEELSVLLKSHMKDKTKFSEFGPVFRSMMFSFACDVCFSSFKQIKFKV